MNDLRFRIKQSLETPARTAPREGSGLLYPQLSFDIVGAAIEVHRVLGPGKLESVYQHAMERELALRRIPFVAQVPIELDYKGSCVGDFVADFIIDGLVIVELKAVERVPAVAISQVLSYLRATQLRLGLLINFNVPVVARNVRRVVL